MSSTRFLLIWKCGHWFVEYRLGERKVSEESSGPKICKGGRQELMYSRRVIYHYGRDEDDRLVSQDFVFNG